MGNIIISKRKPGQYIATQDGRKVAEGDTQNQAGLKAQERRPGSPILAQRVRDTDNGHRDQFRRLYPTED